MEWMQVSSALFSLNLVIFFSWPRGQEKMKLTKTLFLNPDLQHKFGDEDTFVSKHLKDIFGTLSQKNSWSKHYQ